MKTNLNFTNDAERIPGGFALRHLYVPAVCDPSTHSAAVTARCISGCFPLDPGRQCTIVGRARTFAGWTRITSRRRTPTV
jgi:hypothetical protein